MRLSRLFSSAIVVGIAATATIFACGGGGGTSNPDAKVFKDGKVYLDGAAAATGIGKLCTGAGSGNASLCTTSDPDCVTLTDTAFFCTKGCGSGSAVPTNGDALCASGETTTGTAACALSAGSGSATQWACGILCGTSGSASFGTCPTGLTCTSNVCQ